LIIIGVAGVAWDFMCSMLHLHLHLRTPQGPLLLQRKYFIPRSGGGYLSGCQLTRGNCKPKWAYYQNIFHIYFQPAYFYIQSSRTQFFDL